jgi:hypothetical protein
MTHRDCSLTDRAMGYIGGDKLTDESAGKQASGRSSVGRVANELEAVWDRQGSDEKAQGEQCFDPAVEGSRR